MNHLTVCSTGNKVLFLSIHFKRLSMVCIASGSSVKILIRLRPPNLVTGPLQIISALHVANEMELAFLNLFFAHAFLFRLWLIMHLQ
jgi:hypothetical protein